MKSSLFTICTLFKWLTNHGSNLITKPRPVHIIDLTNFMNI